jgi:hypothetical protein
MGANLNSERGNEKNYTIKDRSGITIDPSMRDYSNDPLFVRQLAEAKRSFNESDPAKKKD